jgi:hypothetical protein
MLRISLFGPPNRRKQPERYVQYGPKIFKNLRDASKQNLAEKVDASKLKT